MFWEAVPALAIISLDAEVMGVSEMYLTEPTSQVFPSQLSLTYTPKMPIGSLRLSDTKENIRI